jgi:Na+-exporting ATPase
MRTELGKIADAMERKETTSHTGWAAKWYKLKVLMGLAGTTPLQMKSVSLRCFEFLGNMFCD